MQPRGLGELPKNIYRNLCDGASTMLELVADVLSATRMRLFGG